MAKYEFSVPRKVANAFAVRGHIWIWRSQLCKTILEPLRQHFGEPVIITSGYRCNQLILEHDSKGSYWIHV